MGRDLGAWRWPRPAPVGVREVMAWMMARRVDLSVMTSSRISSWSKDMEHLISTPTGPG